jgi:alanine racemase
MSAPSLLLSQPLFEEIPDILDKGLAPLVSELDFAEALNREAAAAGLKIPVHLKIDTGMGRMGCAPEDAPGLAKFAASCAALEYAGTATHLAAADSSDSVDIAYTQTQIARFREALGNIRAAGIDPGIVHAANSGAVLLHPDSWFDMVRPGILLYGYQTVETGFEIDIKPLMELRTNIIFIKKIKQGESLSYGRTWAAPRNTTVGVLPVGCADGLPRLASNRWQVSIRGRAYPLVGRICMDQCLVDLGPDAQVCRWDEASVFGGPAPDAAVLASLIGTIPYEITCNINKRVPRVYC